MSDRIGVQVAPPHGWCQVPIPTGYGVPRRTSGGISPLAALTPGGPSTWFILDWDQRHIIAVTMDEAQESEDIAIRHLKKHIDSLGPDVYAIHLSQDGELVSVSTEPEDDQGTCIWHEMNLWMRLPQHPNIVPFDRLVLDEVNGRVVGFTTLYIPGGTLSKNKSRKFKLKWLRQLTCVIDDLNLKHGIAHQDVSARNLLIDPKTDALMLFDFNYSGRIGGIGYGEDRNDIKGVIFTLYEIITRDTHFRDVPHYEQNPADVQELDEWVQHPDVQLDHSVTEFRSELNEWVDRRQSGRQISVYTEAPEYIGWPDFPKPPPKDVVFNDDGKGNSTVVTTVVLNGQRRTERKKGIALLNWERPAQIRLRDGDQSLVNGQFVSSKDCSGLIQPN
ncbi:hypothetical protein MAC_02558 [Metarhizium acridum CQMa 102]|uniref:Protein kinase domain-containing protein n=1 Tax=Metarhizium acridum (strain CQMa 102) TaxID=655827 RepID=E9DY60_METAQ|nr:uncharacterized protein MAC_02558 [Metarhizium acridum CQMa 102]EFY91395.1 hypothetical protein MAC_02558 [Metarhizium acridum CQMa 102]